MPTHPTGHPVFEELRAFSKGTVDTAAYEAITAHLADCSDCRTIVQILSHVTFDNGVIQTQAAAPLPTPGPLGVSRDSVLETRTDLPPDVPQELARHPDYEVRRRLGKGGMGEVYLARNRLMNRLEAIKIVQQRRLGRGEASERFLQEIRAVANLKHDNIVTAYSAFRVGESLALAMEYVDGLDLSKVVRQNGPLPIPDACRYTLQVTLGLQHANQRGMVHRDIKPGNLMLGQKEVVKILDFGLAKVRQDEGVGMSLTGDGRPMGTPAYMAPEQWVNARTADTRADIYSLGCTLYHLLTGRPPFLVSNPDEAAEAHRQITPQPIGELRQEVPEGLATLVARMLAKMPEARPQTPAAVVDELTSFIEGPEVEPPPLPVPNSVIQESLPQPPLPGKSERNVVKWVSVALAGMLLISGIVWLRPFLGQSYDGSPLKNGRLQSRSVRPRPGYAFTVPLHPDVEMKFVWVPPGESWLGGGGGRKGAKQFKLEQGLWCGVYPVTQAEWQTVLDDNPSKFKGNPRYPVESVTENSVQDFIRKLAQRTNAERLLFRLPSDAEWEYICRGGPISQENSKYHFYFVRSKTDLTPVPVNRLTDMQANFNKNLGRPSEVGSYLPNPLGIYDMHGNIGQWTSSVLLGDKLFTHGVIRGGNFLSPGYTCTASSFQPLGPTLGPDASPGFGVGIRLVAVPTR